VEETSRRGVEVEWKHMVGVSISGAVRGESADGLDGSRVWERMKS